MLAVETIPVPCLLWCADPETMNPVYGTCQQPGIVPTDCSADCAFDCDTPECSLGCFCGCNPEAKAISTEMLVQLRRRSHVLRQHRMMRQALSGSESSGQPQGADEGVDASSNGRGDFSFWKDALHALKQDETQAKRTEIRLQFEKKAEERKASPRYKRHQLLVAKRKENLEARAGQRDRHARVDAHGHMLGQTRDPFAEADGFSFEKYHPVNPYRVRGRPKGDGSPYEQEVGRMDNVFDPAEDWDNVGSDDPLGETTSWWSVKSGEPASALATDDHWWTHEPSGFAAGRPNPFGSYDNDHQLGWF